MSSRRVGKIVPRPWYVDAIMIGGALLFMLGVMVMANRDVALRWVFSRSIGGSEAKRSVAAWAGGESQVPKSLRVVATRADPGRDSTSWYKFSLHPADVPALKQSVLESVGQRFPPDADADDWGLLPSKSEWPGWWNPDELPDADLYQDQVTHLVFSQRTGLVYVVVTEF
jgi:hypothetical protein